MRATQEARSFARLAGRNIQNISVLPAQRANLDIARVGSPDSSLFVFPDAQIVLI